MTSAAIYARVSSTRQKKDQTIGSQTAALRAHAARLRFELPEEWIFEDEGHSGATLVRPALERLRDLVAQAAVDVVLCYAPDRLARKFAYQALLIEEFARAGTRVEFVRGPRSDSPEDQLLVQFQGIFAEYEKAQLMERYRRGKAYRARAGSVNVLGGAPFGYRYRRKTPECGATYEIVEHEAAMVAELFRRYTDDGASIAELTRWLTDHWHPTRTGKTRWDRSVVWGMLRNPAYAGQAAFGKTQVLHEPAGLNRRARLEGRTTPRAVKTVDQPRQEWTAIPVPAIISRRTFERAAQRLADNKKFASRNSKVPSLLQGLTACASCGYGYYRTSTTTTANNKIYYYRCLGSDDYRYEGGRVCASKPVRADYLDALVWDHITGLLADPHLIRAEIDQRLERARTSDPATRERRPSPTGPGQSRHRDHPHDRGLQEQLITIDELRTRMPGLRARQATCAANSTPCRPNSPTATPTSTSPTTWKASSPSSTTNAATADVAERQRVLRLLVKDVLIGPEKITIRHRIPLREPASTAPHERTTDTESDHARVIYCVGGVTADPLRGTAVPSLQGSVGHAAAARQATASHTAAPSGVGVCLHRLDDEVPGHAVEELLHVQIDDPVVFQQRCRHVSTASSADRSGPVAIGVRMKDRFHLCFQPGRHHRLGDPVRDRGHAEHPRPAAVRFRYLHRFDRRREVGARRHPIPDHVQVSPQIRLELRQTDPVHSRCTLVRLDLLVCLPHFPLRNSNGFTCRLQLAHIAPPRTPPVDQTNSHR